MVYENGGEPVYFACTRPGQQMVGIAINCGYVVIIVLIPCNDLQSYIVSPVHPLQEQGAGKLGTGVQVRGLAQL